MGREVRRVPSNWVHPRKENGQFQPLHDWDFNTEARQWIAGCAEHERKRHAGELSEAAAECYYWEWGGNLPDREYCRPAWMDEERTHLQMYETVSEGTPISPVMATPEELACWLTDNEASAFAGETASYEAWLRVCEGGFACSMVVDQHTDGRQTITSGVEGL